MRHNSKALERIGSSDIFNTQGQSRDRMLKKSLPFPIKLACAKDFYKRWMDAVCMHCHHCLDRATMSLLTGELLVSMFL